MEECVDRVFYVIGGNLAGGLPDNINTLNTSGVTSAAPSFSPAPELGLWYPHSLSQT